MNANTREWERCRPIAQRWILNISREKAQKAQKAQKPKKRPMEILKAYSFISLFAPFGLLRG
jgi:hypothetical protein